MSFVLCGPWMSAVTVTNSRSWSHKSINPRIRVNVSVQKLSFILSQSRRSGDFRGFFSLLFTPHSPPPLLPPPPASFIPQTPELRRSFFLIGLRSILSCQHFSFLFFWSCYDPVSHFSIPRLRSRAKESMQLIHQKFTLLMYELRVRFSMYPFHTAEKICHKHWVEAPLRAHGRLSERSWNKWNKKTKVQLIFFLFAKVNNTFIYLFYQERKVHSSVFEVLSFKWAWIKKFENW